MQPFEPCPGQYALGRDTAVRPLEKRPEPELLLRFRREPDVAGLAGQGDQPAFVFDQACDPQAGAGPEDGARPRIDVEFRTDRADPGRADRRQRQGLRFEIVEQQTIVEPEQGRDLRAVEHPWRIGQLQAAPFDGPCPAGQDGPGTHGFAGGRRRDSLAQAREIAGEQMRQKAEGLLRVILNRDPAVRPADVTDNDRKRKQQPTLQGFPFPDRVRRARRCQWPVSDRSGMA